MAWVKSEYAGEFAVLSTWLVGLLPWSATLFRLEQFSVVAFRFLFFRFQYVVGVSLENAKPFLWTWEIAGFQASPELTLGGQITTAAAAAYLLPFAVSVGYYVDEEFVAETLPVDPVRFLGGAIGVVAVLMTASAALYVRYHSGTTVPIGALLAVILSYLLLTVDRA